jgi:hypothetical protein
MTLVRAKRIEVIVEEPSAEVALRCLLPRLVTGASFEIYAHRCKDELLKRLPDRLRAYARFPSDDRRVLVVVDLDNDDCIQLKGKLEAMAERVGLVTRTHGRGGRYAVVNRIAIEELEAWYFGDWQAVQAAYPGVSATIPRKAKYRNPDAISGGTWESFEQVMQEAGYFRAGFRKIEAARAIAPHMDPARNSSKSFQVFRDALRDMLS